MQEESLLADLYDRGIKSSQKLNLTVKFTFETGACP
jgi:hypothetical protein